MPKLRHIAIAASDPFAAAEFYKSAFDFQEVGRIEKTDDPKKSYGVFLSDGTLNMAVLYFGWDQGPGLDFRGIHHFGVLVDDVDAAADKLESLGATCFARQPPGHKGFYETKFHGPDKVIFDITDHAWRGAAPLEADPVAPASAPKEKVPA